MTLQQTLPAIPSAIWHAPIAGPQFGFRNKAKLAALGQAGKLDFGLPANVAADFGAHDLSDCMLYTPAIHTALPIVRRWLNTLRIAPYELAKKRGELKYLILSEGASQQLMLRLVLRSRAPESLLRANLAALQVQLPTLRVVSVNIQSSHQAIFEGAEEILLTAEHALPIQLNDLALWLGPQSFFQTNTAMAAALYQTARVWISSIDAASAPRNAWDLYCGVGGFGMHLAAKLDSLYGIEISKSAIANAQRAARELPNTQWLADDALRFARAQKKWPDLLLVNPPRRGIGTELADLINQSSAQFLLYSSCSPQSLSADLARLDQFTARHAQLFDMFPNTSHLEVLLLLQRQPQQALL